eukprot:PLAT4718.1.p1 GENE.PLAT4718.1~~PLAT4718.1.p1  ORF type:complete len:210 (+),score=113.63 PLAT4718.1:35-664(+)
MADDKPVFEQTSSLSAAVETVNELDEGKLPLLLGRILKALVAGTSSGGVFTEEEADTLADVLEVSAEDLGRVVRACTYMYEKAAYMKLGLEAMTAALKAVELSDVAVAAFVRVWAEQRAALFARLRQKTLGGPAVLSSVDWRLQLQIGQSTLSRQRAPCALMELELAPAEGGVGEEERLVLEFTKEELWSFFNQIEKVQEQLDALAGSG